MGVASDVSFKVMKWSQMGVNRLRATMARLQCVSHEYGPNVIQYSAGNLKGVHMLGTYELTTRKNI